MLTLEKVLTIAWYTFKEILKSKVLYSAIISGVALILISYVATEFTYGVPEKVALDFGLGMLSLSSTGISLFMGATLLSKEIDSRTVYMVISRPVPRWAFIVGKITGLMGVLVVNVSILSIMTLISVNFLGGKSSAIVMFCILFNILECLLLMLVVVFFSLFSNPILASIISTLILVLGHAVKETQNTQFVQDRAGLKVFLEFYHLILPAFYKLNLKEFVTYRQDLSSAYMVDAAVYGTLYSIFLLLMIIVLFNRRNID
jgi:ABC-type transport system involved in multi-copper enzyme maturation permease subunit